METVTVHVWQEDACDMLRHRVTVILHRVMFLGVGVAGAKAERNVQGRLQESSSPAGEV
jgi:hypothetical protein